MKDVSDSLLNEIEKYKKPTKIDNIEDIEDYLMDNEKEYKWDIGSILDIKHN